MYQREWFQNKQVSQEQFKEEVQKCATAWKSQSSEHQEIYQSRANFENNLRVEAAKQPFQPKTGPKSLGSAAFDAASDLNRKALKKIYRPRLAQTYNQFSQTNMWENSGLGLSSSDGCLGLDFIDTSLRSKEVRRLTFRALHEPVKFPEEWKETAPSQAQDPCFEQFGHCLKELHTDLAKCFVRNFNEFYHSRILA